MYRVRYKHNSALDQVRMVWGSELHPRNVSILCLLSRDDICQEVGSGKKPTSTEDVEDVKHRKFNTPRRIPGRLRPSLQVLRGSMGLWGAPS